MKKLFLVAICLLLQVSCKEFKDAELVVPNFNPEFLGALNAADSTSQTRFLLISVNRISVESAEIALNKMPLKQVLKFRDSVILRIDTVTTGGIVKYDTMKVARFYETFQLGYLTAGKSLFFGDSCIVYSKAVPGFTKPLLLEKDGGTADTLHIAIRGRIVVDFCKNSPSSLLNLNDNFVEITRLQIGKKTGHDCSALLPNPSDGKLSSWWNGSRAFRDRTSRALKFIPWTGVNSPEGDLVISGKGTSDQFSWCAALQYPNGRVEGLWIAAHLYSSNPAGAKMVVWEGGYNSITGKARFATGSPRLEEYPNEPIAASGSGVFRIDGCDYIFSSGSRKNLLPSGAVVQVP